MGGGEYLGFFALKRGTFGYEGLSERGELQKARTRKESSAAEKKKAESNRRRRLRRRGNDGGDDRMRESDEKKRENAMEECATEREQWRRWKVEEKNGDGTTE